MTRRAATRAVLVSGFVLFLVAYGPATALAQAPPLPPGCAVQVLGAAQTLACVPPGWNGDLVVFAHGYVAPTDGPPQIPLNQLVLPDGTSIPGLVTGLGFAFATTSYSDDGLAILEGVQDVQDLVAAFGASWGAPGHVYLVGVSEGGLVTALAVEQSPGVFSGGAAACGPVGEFRRQLDYLGDFRVLFDFYFPGLMPGTVINVPPVTPQQWESYYVPRIAAALAARPATLDKLLRVSRAPYDAARPQSKVETALGILWYSAFATTDAQAKLGGQFYDNSRRLYLGSGSDFRLNLLVPRYHADPGALAAITDYQTSGRLEAPLVTIHTTGDPIVPYWHEPLYTLKALPSGLLHVNLPVVRYGHCSFTPEEALVALGLLVLKVEGRELLNAEAALATPASRERYRELARTSGLRR
jgi:hypothetical protein